MNIIAQILGGIGTLINVISITRKEKTKSLILFVFGNLFVASSLYLLNAKIGMIVEIVFVIETIINFFIERNKKKFKYPLWIILIYILIPSIINIINFNTYWDIFPFIASIVFPLALLTRDTSLRVLNLISVIVWIPYNFVFGQYVGAIGCIIFSIVNLMSIIRYDFIKNK